MATPETQHLDQVIAQSRRRILTLGGAALAGLAFASLASAQSATLTDTDYLNFALNLEFLEANFYTLADSGQTIDGLGLSLKGTGAQGVVLTKGDNNYKSCRVPFSSTLVQGFAKELAAEERNHVNLLQSALGSAAVAQPQIDLYKGFNTFASFMGVGLTTFDPFADDFSFLLGAYLFEDLGVTAYTGALPLLTGNQALDNAAGLGAAEAYHAGLIRNTIRLLDQTSGYNIAGIGYFNEPPGVASQITDDISRLRAILDGTETQGTLLNPVPTGDDIGLGVQGTDLGIASMSADGASSVVNAATDPLRTAKGGGSMITARTPAQVLAILYVAVSGTNGFFPNRLNGPIN